MGVTEDLADQLAQDAIKALELTGDENLIDDIAKLLGATSQTAEEAFMTAVRVRRANARAREMLIAKVRAFKDARETPPAQE